jgi:hypothetical protein
MSMTRYLRLRTLLWVLFLTLFAARPTLAVQTWEFSVKYLGMTAVRASAELERISYDGNTEVEHLLLKAKSTKVYSLLYRVENEYETFIDSQSGYPIRYLRRIDEGSIRGNFTTNFYQEEKRAVYDSVEEVRLQDRSHDFFSAILYLRRQRLNPGDSYSFLLNVDRYDWEVTATVAGAEEYKIDRKRLPAKIVQVGFRYMGPKPRPQIDTDILTYNLVDEKAKLKIFISDDENRLPLRMEYQLWPFSVKAYMNHLPE